MKVGKLTSILCAKYRKIKSECQIYYILSDRKDAAQMQHVLPLKRLKITVPIKEYLQVTVKRCEWL